MNDFLAHFSIKDENIIKTYFTWQCLLFGRVTNCLADYWDTRDLSLSVLNGMLMLLSCPVGPHWPRGSCCLSLYFIWLVSGWALGCSLWVLMNRILNKRSEVRLISVDPLPSDVPSKTMMKSHSPSPHSVCTISTLIIALDKNLWVFLWANFTFYFFFHLSIL